MNSITLTYNKLSVFIIICIKIVRLMESMLKSSFSCVCPLILYNIISILSYDKLLTHSYRSIDHSKSLNNIPINNYSYKTNNRINPLTTYNYFNIPRINIVVVPAKHIPLHDFLFKDLSDESLRTELTIHNYIDSGNNLRVPLNVILDFDHIDHSTLGNIDPDTNFLSNINTSICNYYSELEFNKQFPPDDKFSIFNLNIRSLPKNIDKVKHFLEGLH